MQNEQPVKAEKAKEKADVGTQTDLLVAVTITASTVPAGAVEQTTAATNPVTPVATPVTTPVANAYTVKERPFGRTCG